ncbi:SRPBCC family protein [Palleronia sp.]|uniref:SRPBCC family protein n=1 Tax=Palleronia sp. TaxID=1940284 RepID=UPI0035C7F90D
MKLSARTDVAAPADKIFRHLTDFDRIEAAARNRGAEIERLDDGTAPADAAWRASFPFRGRLRHTEARVVDFEPDEQLALRGESDGLSARVRLELIPLSDRQTRISAIIDLTPATMKARLLVQSLKLARSTLEKRMEGRLRRFGRHVEQT